MLPQYCLGGAMRRCLSCLSCSFCVIQLAIQVLWGGAPMGLLHGLLFLVGPVKLVWVG